jgi:ribosomal-protein-alanine N-acetyltransferase
MKNKLHYPTLETDRIVLKELMLENAPDIFKHFSDPCITESMDIDPCTSIQDAEEIIRFHMEDQGCRWGLFLKDGNELIGTCGFHCLELENEIKAEIGFDLSKDHWGRGLMNEAVTAIISYGFTTMNLRFIEATVEVENSRCQKLLERLRFVKADDLIDNLYYYRLNNKELSAQRR